MEVGLLGGVGHEGRAVMNGISALTKRLRGAPLPFPPCENTAGGRLLTNQEMGSHQTPKLPAP